MILGFVPPPPAVAEDRASQHVFQDRKRGHHTYELEGAGDTTPVDLLGRQTGDSLTLQTDVAIGGLTPDIRFIMVVLPEPLGPIKPIT